METNEQASASGKYTEAELTEDLCGMKAGTEIRIYDRYDGVERYRNVVAMVDGFEFKFYPANGSGGSRIVTERGDEILVNQRRLPAALKASSEDTLPAGALYDLQFTVGGEINDVMGQSA